jgi:hypothetical protein
MGDFFMVNGKWAANDNPSPSPDFRITYHGIISTLDLLTDAAQQWLAGCVDIRHWQWLGKCSLGIDPSVAEDMREALTEAGFIDAEAS